MPTITDEPVMKTRDGSFMDVPMKIRVRSQVQTYIYQRVRFSLMPLNANNLLINGMLRMYNLKPRLN